MNIVQTPVRFFPAVGGVEKYVLDLSIELAQLDHKITVICANEPASELINVDGVFVKRLPYIGKIANTNITLSLLFHLLINKFDLIHTHLPTPWSAELSVLAAKLKRKPIVLTYHNDVEKRGFLGLLTHLYNLSFLKWTLRAADKILITQPTYLERSKYLNPYRNKILVIPNGVSIPVTSQNYLSRSSETILFVGVLDKYHRYKGLKYLIGAMQNVIRKLPNCRLEIVGDGELLGEYQEQAQNLDLANNIFFHGYCEKEFLQKLYSHCSVLVLPSIDMHEGFGIVLLEAMSNGMPVITTEIVGLSEEILEHNAGLVVPPQNSRAIGTAIIEILTDREQAANLGNNGRKLITQKYLWSEICQSVETIYTKLA